MDGYKIPILRTVWCRQRCKEYWEAAKLRVFGESWWQENLRMSRHSFVALCTHIRNQCTKMTLPVPVDTQLAGTIWRLATNIEYWMISALFGLGISTICTIVNKACSMISRHLLPKYVRTPQEQKLKEAVDEFKSLWGFPQVAGAIDGTHIPILKPQESPSDYYNRKGFCSVIMQTVASSRGYFFDVNIGWPGKVHDARVLVNSSFYIARKMEANSFLTQKEP